MKFHQQISTQQGEIWVIDALENDLSPCENESRKDYERRVIQRLIHDTVGNHKLNHHSNGAPFIEKRPDLFLSISHAENWFALYVSNSQNVGIDIERYSNKIERVKTHFLSQSEIEQLQPNLAELQICWGIKESIIKRSRGEVADFQNDIQIKSITKDSATATFESNLIELNHTTWRQFVLVYTISCELTEN